MFAVLVVAWLAAVGTSVWLAGSAWRGSRPFDEIRVNRRLGWEQRHSRWMVWLPLPMLGFFGISLIAPEGAFRHTRLPGGLFMLVWMGVVVAVGWQYARALKRARRKDGP